MFEISKLVGTSEETKFTIFVAGVVKMNNDVNVSVVTVFIESMVLMHWERVTLTNAMRFGNERITDDTQRERQTQSVEVDSAVADQPTVGRSFAGATDCVVMRAMRNENDLSFDHCIYGLLPFGGVMSLYAVGICSRPSAISTK